MSNDANLKQINKIYKLKIKNLKKCHKNYIPAN